MRLEALVDDALSDGRIAAAERNGWLQFCQGFGAQAENALANLRRDVMQASRNANASRSAAEEEAARNEISARFGIPPEHVL